jgi:choloylglycine hydrolase
MKRIINSIIFFSIFIVTAFINGCHKEIVPFEVINETPYGTITKIDDFPLYNIDYTADYKFDQFLETGNIHLSASISKIDKKFACTCFSAFGGEQRLLGRNYDWSTRTSYFMVFTDPPEAYSSVSMVDMYFFNYDYNQPPDSDVNLNIVRTLPYYPFDGMNEKGVAVGMNALDQAEAPYDPSKITIGELQLIRLVLDYAASTEEAVSLIQQYNIRMENPPIHYLIADKSGHSVIIEFINGEMSILENTNPWQVTTNFVITGLDSPDNAPCWRYKNALEMLESRNGTFSELDAFTLLQNVSVSSTRWSTVFNLVSGEFQITMGGHFENAYHFTLQ